MKKLSEMSLEELWQLFPIFLTPHRDCWSDWYREEAARLAPLLPEGVRLSHIGSTAAPGIWAKPIVDILAELPPESDMEAAASALTAHGYTLMSRTETRRSFNRGYTEEGFAERVFHLHLRRRGDNDELYFRDLLREEPETAAEYQRLKLSLWPRFEHDRDGYTEAKGGFVAEKTREARVRFSGRYD